MAIKTSNSNWPVQFSLFAIFFRHRRVLSYIVFLRRRDRRSKAHLMFSSHLEQYHELSMIPDDGRLPLNLCCISICWSTWLNKACALFRLASCLSILACTENRLLDLSSSILIGLADPSAATGAGAEGWSIDCSSSIFCVLLHTLCPEPDRDAIRLIFSILPILAGLLILEDFLLFHARQFESMVTFMLEVDWVNFFGVCSSLCELSFVSN